MRILETLYPTDNWAHSMTSFEVLISTILSQNTTVANERRGLEGLRRRFGRVAPGVLAAAKVRDIERAIYHAGLARQKAPRIHAVAREVLKTWGGDLNSITIRPTAEAREILMALPGVGPKTADVVLAMAGGRPIFPIDTHIARIADRWNLVRRGGYEATRAVLETWTPPRKRRRWHLAIIAHGRSLCKARKPLCGSCPARRDCDWYHRIRTPRTRKALEKARNPRRR
ncbi:MAG TPA: endonuclease III [Thermoplasmata archaeon]|jgi:endonuclease-3